MSEYQFALLPALLIAHLAGEGILNTLLKGKLHGWRKQGIFQLILTLLAHGALAALAIWLTQGWTVLAACFALLIGVMHMLGRMIVVPGDESDSLVNWLEQAMQVFLAAAVWLSLTGQWDLLPLLKGFFANEKVLLVLLAYLVVIWPMSSIIGWVCRPWAKIAEDVNSLPNAGAWIGMLERTLILTFILINQFTAIGFLLAAKSILRFGGAQEKDHRKLTEYVLIGTLTSFTVTIIFGIVVRGLIDTI